MATRPREENQMKLKLAFAILLGAALGIGAIEMLHAQAKPPAYLISDITVNEETKPSSRNGRIKSIQRLHNSAPSILSVVGRPLPFQVRASRPSGRLCRVRKSG
jgi:hypothetical protein